jgi:amino acid transporter
MLSFFVTAGILVGFDASGHVAEETKNASLVAARGVFWSAVAAGLMGFPFIILFLFCTPDLDTLFSFNAPQPVVSLYTLALGQNAHVVMNVVTIIGLMLVCPVITSLMRILPWQSSQLQDLCLLLREMACYLVHGGFLVFHRMVNLAMPLKSFGLSLHPCFARFFRLPLRLHRWSRRQVFLLSLHTR